MQIQTIPRQNSEQGLELRRKRDFSQQSKQASPIAINGGDAITLYNENRGGGLRLKFNKTHIQLLQKRTKFVNYNQET